MTSRVGLQLGDLGALFDGPHATPSRVSSGPYFLNIASLQNGRLHLDVSDHVSEEDFERWTRRVTPQEGDLLFSYETRLGESALMPAGVRACLGRRMALLRPNRGIVEPRFLKYYYLSPAIQALIERNTIHGATVNRIGLSTMGAWPVELPPLPEQSGIADILSALDDKIAANTKLAKVSADLRSALLTFALETDSKYCELGHLVELLSRGIAPSYVVGEAGTVILNQKCIRSQRVDLAPARLTSRAAVRKEKLLSLNDVLINSTGQGTLGRVAIWSGTQTVTVDSHISIVRFDDRMIDPIVGGEALLRLQPEIEAMGEGSTGQTELNRSKIAKLLVTIPAKSAQGPLSEKLSHLSTAESSYLVENEKLATLRDALLPLLMSGKLRVRDAEKQAEAVL